MRHGSRDSDGKSDETDGFARSKGVKELVGEYRQCFRGE